MLVGTAAGVVNGVVIAYGRLVAFIATLAMLAAARGLAEILSNRRTQIVQDRDFIGFFSGSALGVPAGLVFALVAVAGWVLLNRTTFGRPRWRSAATPRPPGWPASGCSGTPWRSTCCPG